MMAFAGMLVDAAEKAGIKVPKDPENFEDQKNEYPHWFVFCVLQLGRSMPYSGVHYNNAKLIGSLSNDEIVKVSVENLLGMGFK